MQMGEGSGTVERHLGHLVEGRAATQRVGFQPSARPHANAANASGAWDQASQARSISPSSVAVASP
jgi:hypothetical protein